METYLLHTVPAPRDVINLPLTLFTDSVLKQECVLEHVNKQNCNSYIAAIAKEANKKLSSLNSNDIAQITSAAIALMNILKEKKIALTSVASILLFDCSHIDEPFRKESFIKNYERFYESIG